MAKRLLLEGFFGLLLSTAALAASEPAPFWETGTVEGDPLFFVQPESADGNQAPGPAETTLLFVPENAPVLRSATMEVTYEAGRDFMWEPGSRKIQLVEGSRIPFKRRSELFPAPESPNSYREARDGKSWMLFGEGRYFHDQQAVASYPSSGTWNGPVPAAAPAEQMAEFRRKLQSGNAVRLVTLGDSISTGANASGAVGAPPGQPGYPELVARGLETRFGVKVTSTNLSVGGMATPWGISRIPAVLAEVPDLLICAFGMNDASGGTSVEKYREEIREIADRVRWARPGCAVILVSPMTANPDWSYARPDLYPAYAAALKTLAGPDCALADVTPVWTAVLERKSYLSLSGNGLNHPNDFGHRLYASVILATIGSPPAGPAR